MLSESYVSGMTSGSVLKEDFGMQVLIPSKALKMGSVEVKRAAGGALESWSRSDQKASFWLMEQVSGVWQKNELSSQYLVYGLQTFENKVGADFSWEMIPYEKMNWMVSRMWQQMTVLNTIAFGGYEVTESAANESYGRLSGLLETDIEIGKKPSGKEKGGDPFCKEEVIERQWVLKGRTIDVLLSNKAIGFGGEKIHFLFVTKAHKVDFDQLSEEEYVESMELYSRITAKLLESRDIKAIHLMHKKGVDAGQTVMHWHLQMIATTSTMQDLAGKATIFKNILLGSSETPKKEFEELVQKYRKEFE